MKKMRIMLPMVAFMLAVVGAVGADFGIDAFRKDGTNCIEAATQQSNCEVRPTGQICTVLVSGTQVTAYANDACTEVLRQIP